MFFGKSCTAKCCSWSDPFRETACPSQKILADGCVEDAMGVFMSESPKPFGISVLCSSPMEIQGNKLREDDMVVTLISMSHGWDSRRARVRKELLARRKTERRDHVFMPPLCVPWNATQQQEYARAACPSCATHTHTFHTGRGNFPRAGSWLVGGANLLLVDCGLTRTALQHRLRIRFLDWDTQCPVCSQVLDRFCHLSTSTTKPPRTPAAALRRRRRACSNPAQTPTPSHSGISMRRTTIPEAWDFAVTSCLRPATRNLGTTTSTENLAEYETLTWTFHDTRTAFLAPQGSPFVSSWYW